MHCVFGYDSLGGADAAHSLWRFTARAGSHGAHRQVVQVLFLVALIFVGGWLPDLRLGMVSPLNIGGALVPFGVCVYLFFHAGTGKEYSPPDCLRAGSSCDLCRQSVFPQTPSQCRLIR